MQSRINPHFLNNALESINWQARMDGDETVAHMVETLSVLLNAAIARDERHLTPLQEELQVVDAYFYFVGLRFGDRIHTEEDIDPEARQALVPRLMIQVLVENAVEHGVSPAGRGRIQLRVRRMEDELLISVTNDGKRLTQDDLERIRRLLELDEPNQGHIGIRNIYQRLQLLFPGKAALSIGLSETGDTVAAIRMPYTENLPNESAALPPKGEDRP
ncbi:MAG: sensor histidine kinase [Lachnospiraceae bacterium]